MQIHSPLPLPLRALLFQHLAAMEKAGVPADRAYALLDLGPEMKKRVQNFRRHAGGRIDPPTAGLNAGLFTLFETRLLRAAFAGGSPLPAYQRLATYYATKSSQRKAMRSRLMLPLAVLTIALLVQPLPQLVAGSISGAGWLLRAGGPLLVLALLAHAGNRLAQWFATGEPAPGRRPLEAQLLSLPLFGPMHLRSNARDFVDSLALLQHAGMPLFDALPLALETVGNGIVRDDLAHILPALKSGQTLAQAVASLRLIDTVQLTAFVNTGEQSGTLPEMLQRHADAETAAIAQFQLELVAWLPRVFYAMVALWMVARLLGPLF